MAAAEWFYARENRQHGPVSPLELRHLAASGQLRPEDLVWREGLADWIPAAKVKGLFQTDEAAPTGPTEETGEPGRRG
ncbi:MAG TPA: DUF4339 domain-containing protein, partial [Planctomycetes bacterium]|nr:DUF4339 domain-containing protein [Planctomycetota bacterium]